MALPLVRLDQISPSGLYVPLGAWAFPALAAAFGACDATGKLHVRRFGPNLTVEGLLALRATAPCDRCGEPLPLALQAHVAVVYAPVGTLPERLESDEATGPALPEGLPDTIEDAGEYDGVTLDLADVVVESFELERPFQYRCANAYPGTEPDFDGIDAACSERLAALSTPEAPEAAHPFSSLAGWKSKLS